LGTDEGLLDVEESALMDLRFLKLWLRRPLIAATDCGGYLCSFFTVKPGSCGSKPLVKAVSKVRRARENRAVGENATRAAEC
jgi:hypothetical protein